MVEKRISGLTLPRNPGVQKSVGPGPKRISPIVPKKPPKITVERYKKPDPAKGLPKWFLEIRAGSEFMPAKIKPVSYNYMAAVEGANRALNFAGATWGDPTAGYPNAGGFNSPTEDVAQGIKTNYNVGRDIENLGGEKPNRLVSGIMRVFDLMSRPLYALSNVHKTNTERNYQTADSAGGEKVTFGEHILGVLDTFTPAFLLHPDQIDDRAKAAWRGFAGYDKTTTNTILETEYPGFSKEHPWLKTAAAITGDVVFDPLTWASLGISGPATLTKSVAAAGLGAVGKKATAKRLLEETLLTSTGREAALDVLRQDIANAEIRRLGNKKAAALKNLEKAAAKNNEVKFSKYDAKHTELKYQLEAKMAADIKNDIKGAAFAWKTIKRGLPTLGIGTISRANIGASHWRRAERTSDTLKAAHADAIDEMADEVGKNEHWKEAWETWDGQDFTYTHNGVKYTVELSKAIDYHHWVAMILKEGAPIARFSEHNVKAGRSRKLRILSAENRGRDFLEQFGNKYAEDFSKGLDPDTLRRLDERRTSATAVVTYGSRVPDSVVNDPKYMTIHEDDLHNLSYDELKAELKKHWDKNKKKDDKARWNEDDPHFILKHEDGSTKYVNLRHLRQAANDLADSRAARVKAAAAADARTAAERSADASAGITDSVAAARARMIDAWNRKEASKATNTRKLQEYRGANYVRAVETTEELTKTLNELKEAAPQEVKDLYQKIIDTVSDASKYSDQERAAFAAILNDTSIPMEERISKILSSLDITDGTVVDIIKEIAQFSAKDGIITASARGEGAGLEIVQKIIDAVFKDRVGARMSEAMLQAAGLRAVEVDGKIKLIDAEKIKNDRFNPNYRRDVHAEIGLAVMEAYRYALDYAVKAELLKEPEILFDTIRTGVDNFLNTEVADIKRQVFQLMYATTGVRLPEDFVPTLDNLRAMFPEGQSPTFQFMKADGKTALSRQDIPWRNLALDIQRWTTRAFDFIKTDALSGTKPSDGLNIEKFARDIEAMAEEVAIAPKDLVDLVDDLKLRIDKLKAVTTAEPINGTVHAVNRYTMLDFIIHGPKILEAQDTTLRVTKVVEGQNKGKSAVRTVSGRLSALDSFTFTDTGVQEGIKALSELHKMARNKKDPEAMAYAQRTLAQLFMDNDGMQYLSNIAKPASGDLKDLPFDRLFSSLGIHARLKEDVVSKGSNTLETKHRADLMDEMWGTQSLHHEWQKALQNKLVHDKIILGRTPEAIAEEAGKELEAFFAGFDKLMGMIHPVRNSGSPLNMYEWHHQGEALQRGWGSEGAGRHTITTRQNNPLKPEPAEFEFKYPVDRENLRTPEKKFTSSAEMLGWLEKRLPYDTRGHAANQRIGAVSMRGSILEQARRGKVKVHQISEGDKIHGLLIIRKAEDGSVSHIVVSRDTPNGKLASYKTVSGKNSPIETISAATEPGAPTQRSTLISADENIPGASMASKGKVKIVEPKQLVVGKKKTDATTALSGTSVAQRAKIAELLEATSAVNKSKEDEAYILNGLRNTPPQEAGLAEQSAFNYSRQVYVNELRRPGSMAHELGLPTDPNTGMSTSVDPADFANVVNETVKYTDAEADRIREWIAKTYAGKSPAKVAQELHALSIAMSIDLANTQSHIIKRMKDYGIQHNANLRIFGVPLMNLPHAMNATHSQAGVTALAQEMSSGRRFFNHHLSVEGTKGQRQTNLMRGLRRSHVIDKALDQISQSYANPAAMARKYIIPWLNDTYRAINKGEYVNPSVGALGRKARLTKVNNQLFNPAANEIGDPLKMFDQTDIDPVNGEAFNPVKTIQDNFAAISDDVFGVDPLSVAAKYRKIEAFNSYMIKKYRLTPTDIQALFRAEDTGLAGKLGEYAPYTTEWLREAGKLLGPDAALNTERLLDINLGQFHYAMHDTALKLDAGDKLHHGVFDEFASQMDPRIVRYQNEKLVPQTVGVNGKQMRGRLVNIEDIAQDARYGISAEHIPAKFRRSNWYISEDLIPEIGILFRYMDESYQINDLINATKLDKILNIFKSSVTIYNIPSYPVRNLLSDVFLSGMDGVINPRVYGDAAKVVWSNHKDMQNMDPKDYQQILDENFFKGELARAQHDPDSVMNPVRNPNKPVVLRFRTQEGPAELNNDQLFHAYEQLGIGQNRMAGEIPQAVAAARRGHAAAGSGWVSDKLRALNDLREDWARMAHFIHAIETEAPLGGNLEDVLRRAGDRVIKFHFDYTDVSIWERKYLAPFIPFYKWTKNIIPFTLANIVLKPKFLNIERAISEHVGNIINDDREDQSEDFIVADWIRFDVPVPIGEWSDPNGNQFQQFALMYLPLGDTMTQTLSGTIDPWFNPNLSVGEKALKSGSGAITTAVSMTNPVIKAGYQAVSGEEVWSSGSAPEREGSNWFKSLSTIVPGIAPLENAIRIAEKQGNNEEVSGKNQWATLLSELGVLRVYNNSENSQKSQNKQTEDLLRGALNKRKAEVMRLLKEKYPTLSDEDAQVIVDEYVKITREGDSARIR